MKQFTSKIIRNNIAGLLLMSAVLMVIVSMVDSAFLSVKNISNIIKTTGLFTTIALAQLCVLSIGQMSLAIGSIGCLSAMLYTYLMMDFGVHPLLAVLICIASATFLGFIQGTVIARTGLNAFIVTLAFQSIYRGIPTAFFKGYQLSFMHQSIIDINMKGFLNVKKTPLLPYIFIIALICTIIIYIFFQKLSIGRKVLLVGDSREAALIAGIQPDDIVVLAHSLSGCLAGIAAILATSRFGSAPLSLGEDWILYSFAGPVLGGTLLSGGRVNVFGAMCGAFFMQVLNYALSFMQVSAYWMQTVLGIVLVAAFAFDYLRGYFAARSALKTFKREFEKKEKQQKEVH